MRTRQLNLKMIHRIELYYETKYGTYFDKDCCKYEMVLSLRYQLLLHTMWRYNRSVETYHIINKHILTLWKLSLRLRG